ncbi:MAG: CheY-P-specific phosphatase CheC [Candidatus Methanogaster sp.]|uniref:CheY-P-specific phosphatase CheC n=1 Tax=Candidatus Methanogaster sp. TaxID=3386292 RepID=A0AC61L4E8_9EURY|nr:MAG: CheY-P-specific phosphatase CheC [ANME-2 cluster archaeon]
MMTEIALTEMEYDALKELGNIGTGHATTALAEMTGVRIAIRVPDISVIPITEIPGLANEEEMMAGLFFELSGDTTDYIQLLFAQDSALALVDILMGREIGSTGALSEMDESALMEIGNILTSAFATAWADFLGITLITSPPTLAFDMAGAVMDYVLATVGMVADQVILFKTVFKGELNVFSGYFMLMPDPESLKNVLKMLGGQIDE